MELLVERPGNPLAPLRAAGLTDGLVTRLRERALVAATSTPAGAGGVMTVSPGRPGAATTRRRVHKIVDELGFVLHTAAQALSKGRSGTLTVVTTFMSLYGFSEIISGVLESPSRQAWASTSGWCRPRHPDRRRYAHGCGTPSRQCGTSSPQAATLAGTAPTPDPGTLEQDPAPHQPYLELRASTAVPPRR
ncbi:hypothetical protein [Cellulosimicrobium funkei]|uniref:hypothetical protein n=1 Tax=Cellulosimicrobium funkei TaxID=264251 RepID=UPI003758211E